MTCIKTSRARKKLGDAKHWIERKQDLRRVIEFAEVKGRVLESVLFSTAHDYHALVLEFEDKTSLTVAIDPCFLVSANFSDISNGTQQVLRKWRKVRSMTYEG